MRGQSVRHALCSLHQRLDHATSPCRPPRAKLAKTMIWANPLAFGFSVETPGVSAQRDYIEGLPLLTVETEANRDSKSTNEMGPSLVCSLGSSWPNKLGRQSCRAACLLMCVSGSGRTVYAGKTRYVLGLVSCQGSLSNRELNVSGALPQRR